MRENGKLNLYALVFYLDDEGIRTELLRLLMRDFDGDTIHYLDASRDSIDLLAPFPLSLDIVESKSLP